MVRTRSDFTWSPAEPIDKRLERRRPVLWVSRHDRIQHSGQIGFLIENIPGAALSVGVRSQVRSGAQQSIVFASAEKLMTRFSSTMAGGLKLALNWLLKARNVTIKIMSVVALLYWCSAVYILVVGGLTIFPQTIGIGLLNSIF
jgi:hypothetical protein